MECEFCQNHEQGDTLYESSDWDGGIGFDYIRNIKYCPLCGRKLNAESADLKTENSSEKPNICEHITEDGVTCAKYPACDDCLDNPLNKVKGSERLVKGTEQTEPQYSEDDMYWLSLAEDVANGKMSDAGANQAWLEYINHKDEPTISKMEQVDKDINVRSKDEPQTDCSWK